MGSGANNPVPLTGNGVYSVSPSGYVLLDNPNPNAANVKIDARLGDEGEILVGESLDRLRYEIQTNQYRRTFR